VPVQDCSKDGKSGKKFGPSGVCFTGPDAAARAAAVGRAIEAQKAELAAGHLDDELSQGEIEGVVAMADAEGLVAMLSLPTAGPVTNYSAGPEVAAGVRELRPNVVKTEIQVAIHKHEASGELQLVWAEVYVPGLPDAHGDSMSIAGVRKMAHKFLASQLTQSVDVQHDNDITRDLEIVESFIAREDDPEFIPNSWVVCCHVADPGIWLDIKEGRLNGFSIQANVFMQEREIEFEVPADGQVSGRVSETESEAGILHTHGFTVRIGPNGELLGGQTTVDADHWHSISGGTLTEGPVVAGSDGPAPTSGHTHRYSCLEHRIGAPMD